MQEAAATLLESLRDFKGTPVDSVDELRDRGVYFCAHPSVRRSQASGEDRSRRVWFSPAMLGHVSPSDRYPERPQRVLHAARLLAEAGYLSPSQLPSSSSADDQHSGGEEGQATAHRLATWDEIRRIHPGDDYAAYVATGGDALLFGMAEPHNDLHMSLEGDDSTRVAALTAAALCMDAATTAIEAAAAGGANGETDRNAGSGPAFCLVRPPGHHCGHKPNGFCIFNNVMLAAAAADAKLRAVGPKLGTRRSKIAIIDIDVHHGDGTQKLVDEWNARTDRTSDILFISTHRYDRGTFFPCTGHPTSIGAQGLCINVGFDTARKTHPARVMCDHTFEVFASNMLEPILEDAFRPDVVFISCGFDAAEGDPLGGMAVVRGFERIVHAVCGATYESGGTGGLRTVPVIGVLEGGYDVEAVGRAVVRVVDALAAHSGKQDHPPPTMLPAQSWVQEAAAAWPLQPPVVAAGEEADGNSTQQQPFTGLGVMPASVVAATVGRRTLQHRRWALEALLTTAQALDQQASSFDDDSLPMWARNSLVPDLQQALAAVVAPDDAGASGMDSA